VLERLGPSTAAIGFDVARAGPPTPIADSAVARAGRPSHSPDSGVARAGRSGSKFRPGRRVDRTRAWRSRGALRAENTRIELPGGSTRGSWARAGSPGDDRRVGKRRLDRLERAFTVVGDSRGLGRVGLAATTNLAIAEDRSELRLGSGDGDGISATPRRCMLDILPQWSRVRAILWLALTAR
jgi:hypothetical protein